MAVALGVSDNFIVLVFYSVYNFFVLMLLSAHVKRFSVYLMQNFHLYIGSGYYLFLVFPTIKVHKPN